MGANKSDKESNQHLIKKFREICADLNLDKSAADEAFNSFQRIQINYTLEGDKLHWLACALYVACRKGVTPTVGGTGSFVEGNCVSLTRLLMSCKLSLVNFFNKMKKWSDMANLSHEMRNKIEKLERNFNVSTVIFKKFEPIFSNIFKSPITSPSKQPKNRKQSRKQCLTSGDVFSFCWTLFVHIKASFPAISDDLVNSYHLLLACIDFCYSNVLVTENAKELLNLSFSELPSDFASDKFVPPEPVPCIIETLCEKWQGICVDAKGIKEHWWKPCVKRMVEKKVLKCRNLPHLLGFLDINFYEANFKSISKEYEQYVLNIGDFDERIFFCDNAHEELGTKQTSLEEFNERMQNQTIKQKLDETRSLVPTTPLSNRHYLANRENMGPMTPVTNATQTVSRLHSLLLDCKPEPSPALLELFEMCSNNPYERILERNKELGEKFLQAYSQPFNDNQYHSANSNQPNDFAKKRLNFATILYYKSLESIMIREEKKCRESFSITEKGEFLSSLLFHEIFHVALFACCIEIVLFSYNSKKVFPWIIEVYQDYHNLHFQPFHFYRVIELIIREENGLSRDVAKHLNSIEEQVLESMAWKSESSLWETIRAQGSIPLCQDVALPNTLGTGSPTFGSPFSNAQRFQKDVFQSPKGSTVSDRFLSPTNSSARRRLFDNNINATNSNSHSHVNELSTISSQQIVQIALPAQTNTGEVRYIQFTLQQPQASTNETNSAKPKFETPKANKALNLFFRKVYHLGWIRLRHLCDQLNILDEDLRRKIWTCFETSLRSHTDLMRDRHLDQLLMCTVYSMCKIIKKDQSFQEIMRYYRLQPQAQSHVYRSVLLTNRSRRNSSSSDNSRNSGSNSPILEDKDRIRSSSTLPVPHPNSQPPTPTRLAGTGSNFEFDEERGDLIMFYNQIYIPEMKQYIMKFSDEANSPPLSPLPRLAANSVSPYRRVSNRHSLYISPLKMTNFPPSPKRPLSYHFLRSPAKDLRAINSMMRQNASGSEKKVIKRLLQDEYLDNENSPKRRLCAEPVLRSKIQNIYSERQEVEVEGEDNGDVDIE